MAGKPKNVEFHKPEGSGTKVFYEDKPYAHMYMKDKDGLLVRMVETQPMMYLMSLVENIQQSTQTVTMLNVLNQQKLDEAERAIQANDEDTVTKVMDAMKIILGLKKDISGITQSAPSDIDNLKTLMTRLLQDSQAEDAMTLIGGREMSFRENAVDVSKANQPEIIKMPE